LKRTKIVATFGPACAEENTLRALVEAGVNVIRINASHQNIAEQNRTFELIGRVGAALGREIPILLDLPGPKLRIIEASENPLFVEPGEMLRIYLSPASEKTGKWIEFRLPRGTFSTSRGEPVYIADGTIALEVDAADDTVIIAKVINGGKITVKKGITFPDSSLHLDVPTENDMEIFKNAYERGIRLFSASFIEDEGPFNKLKSLFSSDDPAFIIGKIEKKRALKNLETIIGCYDGIMVARGDLGVETPIDEVGITQKRIIRLCTLMAKPVITATQMLESMVKSPLPTRAEVTDVTNAILDGTDAVMLSEETAIGDFPVQTVRTMSKICKTVEHYRYVNHIEIDTGPTESLTKLITKTAVEASKVKEVNHIITPSLSGQTTRLTSAWKPECAIIAPVLTEGLMSYFALLYNVTPVRLSGRSTAEQIVSELLEIQVLQQGETIVMISGYPIGTPGNTNSVQVFPV
jgi:pyruvate kinase